MIELILPSDILIACLNYNKDKRINNLIFNNDSLVSKNSSLLDQNKKITHYIDSSINARGLKPIPFNEGRKSDFKFWISKP